MRTRTLLAAALLAALCGAAIAHDARPPAMGMTGETMQRMQEQMKKIQAASDPKERQRLVEEHMKTMQEAMPMMAGMMSMQGCMGMTPQK